MKRVTLILTVVLLLGEVGQAKASLVYSNGPINGTDAAYTINFGLKVSDSFVVSNTSNLTTATIGVWAVQGTVLNSVQWSIGTSSFGNNVASGTASSVNNVFKFTNRIESGYSIFESTFPIGGSLAPGTYWLTLQNAGTTPGYEIFWDLNNGPSTANDNFLGNIPSESF